MPGTGIKGYTGPALYGGSYNISNGIITSGSAAQNITTPSGAAIINRNSPYGSTAVNNSGSGSSGSSSINSRAIANGLDQSDLMEFGNSLAMNISDIMSRSTSDYADLVRELMANADANTAKSQQFAREQMEYQSRSDQAAMAWSAAEAQKNRDWQERLSDTAHQREVKDLIAAGLNPILSANNGAYTGSGATGQGFSSSGAMGSVDTSATGAIGSLIGTVISSATQAQIAQMYTDAERYSADLQYSSSRLATEASISNNQNTTSAQKWIATNQMLNDLEKTRLSGEYGLQNTALSNEGAYSRTALQEMGANQRNFNDNVNANYRTNQTNESNERQTESRNASGSFLTAGPWRSLINGVNKALEKSDSKLLENAKKFLEKSNGRSSSSSPYSSKLLSEIGWG